ncbi:MAG: VanZ family protein [Candidatus Doudnabacteria bacterium]|nr:VanZ family protein [Candidatus Doudnabacteria bacterium]
MSKRVAYYIWIWGSTLAFLALVLWLSFLPNLDVTAGAGNEALKVLFRMFLYAMLFILLYRSVIGTLKNSVSRLAVWHSKREAKEDTEFLLIIETLVVLVTIFVTVLISIFDEAIQTYAGVEGRSGDIKDILISTMAVLLTALIVYTMPVIGELEMAVKHRLQDRGHKKE